MFFWNRFLLKQDLFFGGNFYCLQRFLLLDAIFLGKSAKIQYQIQNPKRHARNATRSSRPVPTSPTNTRSKKLTTNYPLSFHHTNQPTKGIFRCCRDSNRAEIIALRCFLIATMASLRFRDLLGTKPQSLSVQGHILRSISWRSKTSVSGQPWGVCCLGISTRPSEKHWIFRFLETIDLGISRSQRFWGQDWEPDFLLPSWTDSIPFSSPCSYHHGLALIRYYAQCNWMKPPLLSPEQALGLSTHSMKSTLLAAAGQLNINVEQRAKPGPP